MSNLLDRSTVRIKSARALLELTSFDDAYCDTLCFDIQQAIEFLLKWKLNLIGVEYKKVHDLTTLCDLLVENGFNVYSIEHLEGKAPLITKWETESRYGSGIKTTRLAVEQVFEIYNSLVQMLVEEPEIDPADNKDILLLKEMFPESFASFTEEQKAELLKDLKSK